MKALAEMPVKREMEGAPNEPNITEHFEFCSLDIIEQGPNEHEHTPIRGVRCVRCSMSELCLCSYKEKMYRACVR